ncbi:MAG TPA: MlaD family protein [Spirochaetia bacterium]|nr:MlaD family protein [Spirochaetia bacterium]
MKSKHNELAIGITVTVATLIVVLTILLLGKSSVITVGMRIDMTVANADGLGAGDQVLFRGIPIGSVQSVELEKHGVIASLKLKGSPEIPVDSRFVIKESSLLGGKSVEIRTGTSSTMLQPDARVAGHSQGGILSMAEGSSGVGDKVSEILSNINTLSGQQTLNSVYETLRNLNELTQTLQAMLDANKQAVAATITNLREMSSTANTTVDNLNSITVENREPIRNAIASVNETTAQLQTAIRETDATVARLNSILVGLQEGHGSLGKLMVDDSLYTEIKSTVAQVDSLVKDIQQNPKKYVTFKLF